MCSRAPGNIDTAERVELGRHEKRQIQVEGRGGRVSRRGAEQVDGTNRWSVSNRAATRASAVCRGWLVAIILSFGVGVEPLVHGRTRCRF